jgi:hypothetical protein
LLFQSGRTVYSLASSVLSSSEMVMRKPNLHASKHGVLSNAELSVSQKAWLSLYVKTCTPAGAADCKAEDGNRQPVQGEGQEESTRWEQASMPVSCGDSQRGIIISRARELDDPEVRDLLRISYCCGASQPGDLEGSGIIVAANANPGVEGIKRVGAVAHSLDQEGCICAQARRAG